jgi:hypothetical protein
MKTEFQLVWASGHEVPGAKVSIIGQAPEDAPYLSLKVYQSSDPIFIQDKDLERFAVNILKALKSKKLNTK